MTRTTALFLAAALLCAAARPARADGVVLPPRDYEGSLEESAQEAIIVFGQDDEDRGVEDLVLKIRVEGAARDFGWIVPLPNPPETAREDAALFRELFDYVQARLASLRQKRKKGMFAGEARSADEGVEVVSRRIVGSYDVAVVRETEPGRLNAWLEDQGYRTLKNAGDVVEYYRARNFVFACIKVSEAALEGGEADLHPLRFTFETGGRDGVYFPMKMTGLQTRRFDVNLYVFYRAWLNDDLNQFGFAHRGFSLVHRDWDTRECLPNGGKTWSTPASDPYLRALAPRIPAVQAFFRRLHPGERYYLTNLQASRLDPAEVRLWACDLWLFPYYTDRSMVPYDARRGGPAAEAYPTKAAAPGAAAGDQGPSAGEEGGGESGVGPWAALLGVFAFTVLLLGGYIAYLKRLGR